ncbi:MAG: primosomal protein N' [Candidatus Omnitrophica bacterium]|nr:primosomal protein N' [Candidatus Omnitrophota bacterium]
MSENKFVQVAINLPLNDVFDYSVPQALQPLVKIGKRVWISFGNRTIVGFIVGISASTAITRIKEIKSVIDKEPILSSEILELTRWIADYYLCSWGEAIDAAIAMPFKKGKTSIKPRLASQLMPGIDYEKKVVKNILTSYQTKALLQLNQSIVKREFNVFLLHGITASGKTEVYFGAIEQTLKQGRDVLVFIPEIALTPQTVQWFTEKFGKEKIALVHSRLSAGEKFIQWQRIKSGQAKIVIGPRSAIFSPLKNLGLIVVDEEHENTYKQEDTPRYHLINTAIKRAQIAQATVILGSATPSLESNYAAKKGDFELIELPERIKGSELPQVQIVDMSNQSTRFKRLPILSKVLEDNISRCLKNKEQIIIFLNRRGFSTFVNCNKCGYVLQCPKCNLSLVYHSDKKCLVCHHCSYMQQAVQICPKCSGSSINYLGTGTQKVESELSRIFPLARIARMDSDSMRKKTAHFEALDDFKNKKIDILVGTQMLAKGLDFPNVTLVGVISADISLNLPDFRASERTFSLLTQVAGRAGRGKIAGKVIIQTYTPDHYAIECAINHDYKVFYEKELLFRKQLNLPPFSHLISIVLRSKEEKAVISAAENLGQKLMLKIKGLEISMIGPMPMPIYKLKGYFRCGLILNTADILNTNKLIKELLKDNKLPSKIKLAIDVDPRMVI